MANTGHLTGLKAKMAARDKRHAAKGNKSVTGKRIKAPASPPPVWPGNKKSRAQPAGAPFSRNPEPTTAVVREPALNRWTGKPHEHRREIARNLRRGAKKAA